MTQIKLLDLNIEGDNHFDKILPFIRKENPDVICFQEVFQADVDYIKRETGFECRYEALLHIGDNDVNLSPKGLWGITIFTRFPILATHVEYYSGSKDHIPTFFGEPNTTNRAALMVDLQVADQIFRIGTTHFTWSPAGSVTDEQHRDLKNLLAITDRYQPLVLTGDFNAPRGKEIFDTLATKFTDNIPSEVMTSIDPNLHRVKNLQYMVDGLFTTSEYVARDVRVVSGVSDHQAIVGIIQKDF